MNSNILQIWENISLSNECGLLKRLYTNEVNLYVYAIIQNPEKQCGIALSFDKNIHINISQFSKFRDLQIMLMHDKSYPENNLLVIKLLDSQIRDVFGVMCDNMIQSVLSLGSEKLVIKAIINQLEKWQALFEKVKGAGLTLLEQQGLYGELYFLHKFILERNFELVLTSWVGPSKEIRDFQYNNWAVEVKTTIGNNHQKICISNERQLDETLLDNLFLYHLSVEASKGNGDNLNEIIKSIRNSLQDNFLLLNVFNNKLLESGYFDKHSYLYNERSYKIRNESYYKIDNDFPRIKEKEIRNGVGDVKYTIILSQFDQYLVSENMVFKKMNVL